LIKNTNNNNNNYNNGGFLYQSASELLALREAEGDPALLLEAAAAADAEGLIEAAAQARGTAQQLVLKFAYGLDTLSHCCAVGKNARDAYCEAGPFAWSYCRK